MTSDPIEPNQMLTSGPNGEHVWRSASMPVTDYRPELQSIAKSLDSVALAILALAKDSRAIAIALASRQKP
jgi:hypothetical protein